MRGQALQLSSNNTLFVGSSSLIPLRNSIIQYFLTIFELYVPGDTRDSRGKHCKIKFLCTFAFCDILSHYVTKCHATHVPSSIIRMRFYILNLGYHGKNSVILVFSGPLLSHGMYEFFFLVNTSVQYGKEQNYMV